jgi:1-acyl-sn-glycerol-3-phosphate acyltransferase
MRKLRLVLHILRGALITALLLPRASRARRQAIVSRWSLQLLGICGMGLVVHGNRAAHGGAALVVSNHVSWIDIFVIDAWRPTPFVAKAEIARWPVIGWLSAQAGTIFIERTRRSDARRIVTQLAATLEAGGQACVFPEGTTSDGAAILPFHTNLLQAAVSAQKPVLPLALWYEDAAGRQSFAPAFVGELTLAQTLDAMLRAAPLTAHLSIGTPLAPGESRRALGMRAQAAVAEMLARGLGRAILPQAAGTEESGDGSIAA